MKKYLYVIIIILIIFLSITLLLKNDNEKVIVNDIKKKYPFYKIEYQNEYQEFQKKNNCSEKDAIIMVNIGLNRPFYDNPKEVKDLNNLTVLVNKYNYLPKNYVPNNLVSLDQYAKKGISLNSVAYDNFKKMANDAYKEDNLKLRIVSSYRSFKYQENLYNKYLKYETQEIVDTYSARAGFSEHQTGLAIDIDNEMLSYNKFHLTQEFTWMMKNAYKYGFILRYPLGKEKITGYKYEPWHYRYVGKKISTYIHNHNITYEEYYYEFIDK